MSSQQQLGLVSPPLGLGEVDHVRSLSDNFNALLLSDNYQDITLVVENQRIPAHKIILASRSEYFRYMSLVFLKKRLVLFVTCTLRLMHLNACVRAWLIFFVIFFVFPLVSWGNSVNIYFICQGFTFWWLIGKPKKWDWAEGY
jgi:hypothetical protein